MKGAVRDDGNGLVLGNCNLPQCKHSPLRKMHLRLAVHAPQLVFPRQKPKVHLRELLADLIHGATAIAMVQAGLLAQVVHGLHCLWFWKRGSITFGGAFLLGVKNQHGRLQRALQ